MSDQTNDRLVTVPIRSVGDQGTDPSTDVAPPVEGAGLTVEEFARRYRVGTDKVRQWIDRGEVKAINTATTLSGKPRWVIPAEAVAAFEVKRTGGPAPKAPKRRRRPEFVDYWPNLG